MRRFFRRLRNQEWIAFGVDFVIVVLGVFIGIQAANLNSARIDRSLEQEYLDRIEADLDTVIAVSQRQIRFEQGKSRQVMIAVAMTHAPPSPARTLRFGSLLTMLTVRMSPNFESSTFNDLQNSGRLSLIDDPKLRNALSAYFARLQWLRTQLRLNNDSFAETFADFLRREGIGAGYADPAVMRGMPMSPLDNELASLSRERFGLRDPVATGSELALPAGDRFWERLRANLAWRGNGAIANERILKVIAGEAIAMRRDAARWQAANR